MQPVIRTRSAPAVTATSLRFMRVDSTPSLPTPAIQENLDPVVARELPSQIIVEVLAIPRRDYEISNHGRFPLPKPWCPGFDGREGLVATALSAPDARLAGRLYAHSPLRSRCGPIPGSSQSQ